MSNDLYPNGIAAVLGHLRAKDHPAIIGAGSKGYVALKDMLANCEHNRTILVESLDVRDVDESNSDLFFARVLRSKTQARF